MNDLRTAAQQALEALEWSWGGEPLPCKEREAITALKAALSNGDNLSPTEPVAHFGSAYVNENGVHVTTVLGPVAIPQDAKLYTTPPQRKPTVTDLQEALADVALIDRAALDDAEEYDGGATLAQIDVLHQTLFGEQT